MATFTVEDTSIIPGLEPSLNAANSGGDDCANTGAVYLYVENTSAADETITFDDTETSEYGQDIDPPAQTVPAGSFKIFGPFPKDKFGGSLSWSYSSAAAFQVAPFRAAGVVPQS